MYSLRDYLTHLRSLDETRLVLEQQLCTVTCLETYFAILKELRVSSLQQTSCKCTSRGSNRTGHYPDDISVTRAGQAALNHFSKFGEQLLKEIDQKQGSMKEEDLDFIKERFNETEGRFQDALHRLKPGENLVSYETLTRGYRLDFEVLTDAALESLSLSK